MTKYQWYYFVGYGMTSKQRQHIYTVQNMCEEVKTNDWTCGGETKDFPMMINLHQGSSLSHLLLQQF